MGTGATAKYALPYPVPTDNPNIEGDMEALANAIDAILAPYAQDLIANRPAAGKTGRTFTQTDGLAGTTWRDSGADWRSIGSRVQANAANDIAQIVRGFAGQTADLFRVEDSAGNPMFEVNASGYLGLGGTGITVFGVNAPEGFFWENNLNRTPLYARGAAGQSAHLQEWQNNAGGVLAYVDSGGNIYGSGTIQGATLKATSQVRSTYETVVGDTVFAGSQPGALSVSSWVATQVAAVIRGFAGQTADLTQWQNSAGSVLAHVGADGATYAPVFGAGTSSYIGGALSAVPVNTTQSAIIARGLAGQTGDLQQWQDSTGALKAKIANDGGTYSPYTKVGQWSAAPSLAALEVMTLASSEPGVIVKGATSQSTDLTQWQDSTGAVLAKIGSDGNLSVRPGNAGILYLGDGTLTKAPGSGFDLGGTGLQNLSFIYAGADVDVAGSVFTDHLLGRTTSVRISNPFLVAGSASAIGAVVQGASGQTAHLQEWQDNGGGVLAAFDQYGNLGLGVAPSSGVGLFNQAKNASHIPAAIRAAAGQAADLQQWQDSAGNILANITSGGALGAYASAVIQPATASGVGVTVKGRASQTADLQQWQNSAGTVLASVDAVGNLYANGRLSIVATQPGNPVALVRGAASQTADLQQWQDSTGAVKVNVTAGGGLIAGKGFNTGGADFSLMDAGTADVNACRLFSGSGSIYIQPGTGAIYFRNHTGGNVGSIDNSGQFVGGGTVAFTSNATEAARGVNGGNISGSLQGNYGYLYDENGGNHRAGIQGFVDTFHVYDSYNSHDQLDCAYNTSKSFVIDHPTPSKTADLFLVHACIEGPENAVFYRGQGQLDGGHTVIELPAYWRDLVDEGSATVHVTPIGDYGAMLADATRYLNKHPLSDRLSEQNDQTHYYAANLAASSVVNGKFVVSCIGGFVIPDQKFSWTVMATRKDIAALVVEPNKRDVARVGDGPYTYLKAR